MSNILLLRAPSHDAPDRYEAIFASSGYRAVSLPVLETVHTNLDALESILCHSPAAGPYGGVILTSKRACEAWNAALQTVVSDSSTDARGSLEAWSGVPFYVVGQGTASALTNVQQNTGYRPVDIRGESSGTGEKLAQFIVHDISRRSGKLLYLTGDKNRDTLPGILKQGGVEFEPLQVYETRGSSAFGLALGEALAASPKDDTTSWWIVYFAPSAADFVTPILRDHFALDSCKIAAIGPTTEAFLREKLNLHVDVVASQPTPEGLFAAVIACDQQSRT